MKTIKILTMITIASLFAMSGCKSEDAAPGASFTAKIDGATLSVKTKSAGYYNNETFVMAMETNSGDIITVRMLLFDGYEVGLPYQFYYEDETDALAYVPNGESAYTTNQFDGSTPFPGEMSFTKFDKTSKKCSGSIVTEARRILDDKIVSVSIEFVDLPFSTELPPTPGKTMTATVDGSAWSATNVTAVKGLGMINTVGNGPNNTAIGIVVPDNATVGEHEISFFGDYRAQYNASSTEFYTPTDGTINITEFDDISGVIKGTFSFEAEKDGNTVSITGGSFVATY